MDQQEAHRHFSVECFNDAWGLLEKPDRSPVEDRLMREMAHASLFHWLRREDCEALNISVGLWLVSRVSAVLGQGAEAEGYARDCIEVSESSSLEPFYVGYSYEAVARAMQILGDSESSVEAIAKADEILCQIESEEEKEQLKNDLQELREQDA